MLFLLADSPQKLKLEKVHGALIAFFYASPISTPLQSPFKENAKILSKKQMLSKNIKKNNRSSASNFWENTKSSFKENARTFSKNSTSQEDIIISGPKEYCKTYAKKKTANQKLNQ